ncbi:MAG: hypothetical protein AAGD23_07785 [Pseudomonadota bacterium]
MTTVAVPRQPLAWVLLTLRLSVFLVMLLWTVNKFLFPERAASIFENFYGISGLGTDAAYLIGAVQLAVVIGFAVGFQKRWTTGLVLVMHLISTLASMPRYFDPWSSPNLLFFAAWPMLGALIALYVLRDFDTKWSLGGDRDSA